MSEPPGAVAAAGAAQSPAAAAAAATPSPALALPDELLRRVASFLSGWELSRCVNVCTTWRQALTQDAALWRAALQRDFADGTPARVLAAARSLVEPAVIASFRSWPAAEEQEEEAALATVMLLAAYRDAGGPPALLAAHAAVADAAAEPHAWRAVRVLERWPTLTECSPVYPDLTAWWDNLSRPYDVVHVSQPLGSGRATAGRPRRVRLHMRHATPGAPDALYQLYQALAAALLPWRCRVCACPTKGRHPVLRVPMCVATRCSGVYPVMRAEDAAAALGVSWCAAAAGLAAAGARRGEAKTRCYRRGVVHTFSTPLVLASSVESVAAQMKAPNGSAAAAELLSRMKLA
jgi:hypothetical protein